MAAGIGKKKKRGPKPLSVPKGIAVRMWARAVESKMRPIARPDGHLPGRPALLTPHELEKTAHNDTGRWQSETDGIRRPKQFDYLAKGKHWPRQRTVDYFNRFCPEVTFWLYLDLWSLLEEESPPIGRLHQIMRLAGEDIRSLLFERVAPGDPFNPSMRRRATPRQQIAPIVRAMGDVEALTILLALLREAELKGDVEGHVAVAKHVLNLTFALAVWSPWMAYAHEIFRQLRKAVFPKFAATMERLRITWIHPDEEVSLRLSMSFSAETAGLVIEDDPKSMIQQMLLLEQMGRKQYLEFLLHNSKTGRVIVGQTGIMTGYVAD